MNTSKSGRVSARLFCAAALGVGSFFSLAARAADSVAPPATVTKEARPVASSATIPWSEVGAKAGAGYQGDGLRIIPTAEGARLRCIFQRLEGEATREGLWLVSTVTNALRERFRVLATAVGRTPEAEKLPSTGAVSIDGQTVRFVRPALVEEYSASMDGVRQDFVLLERPEGEGELRGELDVTAAKIEPASFGAQLLLESSGRKIAYGRLRVTDATGKELSARIEAVSAGAGAFRPLRWVNEQGHRKDESLGTARSATVRQ